MKYLPAILILGLLILNCTNKVMNTNISEIQDQSEAQNRDRKVKARRDAAFSRAKENTLANLDSIISRPVLKRVLPKNKTKSGKVTFDICINPEGKVIDVKYNRAQSTLTDKSIVADAFTAMRNTTFQPDSSAPEKEFGQWTIIYSGPRDYGCQEGKDFDKLEIQREVTNRVLPNEIDENGTVVFNICINRGGKVIYAKYNRAKSTLTDRSTVSSALHTMKKTTFKSDNSASSKECGQWIFTYNGQEKVQSALYVVKKQN